VSPRHCEERSDEAIQTLRPIVFSMIRSPAAHEDWIASLRSQ
jgi:hypothetical protein